MNLSFAANGLLFLAGNIFLLQASGQKNLTTARLVNAVLYCIGIILVGAVAGGPKEHECGSVIWHVVGASLAIIGANANSLLAGFASPADHKPVYRTISLFLGVAGLSALGIFLLLGNEGHEGILATLLDLSELVLEVLHGLLFDNRTLSSSGQT